MDRHCRAWNRHQDARRPSHTLTGPRSSIVGEDELGGYDPRRSERISMRVDRTGHLVLAVRDAMEMRIEARSSESLKIARWYRVTFEVSLHRPFPLAVGCLLVRRLVLKVRCWTACGLPLDRGLWHRFGRVVVSELKGEGT